MLYLVRVHQVSWIFIVILKLIKYILPNKSELDIFFDPTKLGEILFYLTKKGYIFLLKKSELSILLFDKNEFDICCLIWEG